MKILSCILALLFIGCGPADGDTINIASGENSEISDDPVVQSECGGSDDQCAQRVD